MYLNFYTEALTLQKLARNSSLAKLLDYFVYIAAKKDEFFAHLQRFLKNISNFTRHVLGDSIT